MLKLNGESSERHFFGIPKQKSNKEHTKALANDVYNNLSLRLMFEVADLSARHIDINK